MINFKKGPALSLHQINYVAKPADSGQNIVAGQLVRVTDDGVYVGLDTSAPTALYGFAINSITAGDVIESGVVGVFALDGASVIETDQYVEASYSIGQALTANTDGQLLAAGGSSRVIGWVEGQRQLPGKENQTETITLTDPVTGATKTRSFSYQPSQVTMLAVKLSS